jgi:hypothetical protein
MKKNTFPFLITAMLFFSGCATLFSGTKDRIYFNSSPEGATILIDGVEQCKSPCSLWVKRSIGDTDVELKLEGYNTRIITLSHTLNVISILNLGNLFGWGIDAISGAVMRYDKKAYEITLDKKSTSYFKPVSINIDTRKNLVELFVVQN